MGKKKNRSRNKPSGYLLVTPKHGVAWHAPAWWQERPPEPSLPERINDAENPVTAAFMRRQLGCNDHPLTKARDTGRLHAEYDHALAAARHKAGMDFMELWLLANRGSGRDSTRMSEVHASGEVGFDDARSVAILRLVAIRSVLSNRDSVIVQLICGERWEFAPAVRAACGASYKFEVTARVCEALDALMEAFRFARGKRGKPSADRFANRGENLPSPENMKPRAA